MALNKNITSDCGLVCSYHKVESVTISGNRMNCIMQSYVSKDYRDLERPADHRFFDFDITIEEEESMGARQLAYKKIKELDEWSDAEDC